MEEADRTTILIIDDEAGARQTIRRMLEYYDYKVLEGRGGIDGLDIYRAEQSTIDLVLLDLIMPGMSGEETLEHLLSLNPQAKVVICTGRAILGLPRKEQYQKAVAFIKKPFTAETLLAKVRNALIV